jgi:tetratricopeptide (TPR) repeat protein
LATVAGQTPAQSDRQRAQQHLERGLSYSYWDDPRAEEEYKQAIAIRAGVYPEAWNSLSDFLWGRLRFEEAADAWQKYLEQSPASKIPKFAKDLQKRLKRAAFLKSKSDKGETLSLVESLDLTILIEGFGSEAQGLPYAEKTVQLYPESSKALVKLAELIDWKQKDRARELFNRAIAFEPREPANYLARAQFHYWVDVNATQAAEDFRKVIELGDDKNASAWWGLGGTLARLGRRDEAIAAFKKYLSLRPVSVAEHDKDVIKAIELLKNGTLKP